MERKGLSPFQKPRAQLTWALDLFLDFYRSNFQEQQLAEEQTSHIKSPLC